MTAISPDLLDAFTQRFAGYGNAQAPVWFIGMEEGSGQSLAELLPLPAPGLADWPYASLAVDHSSLADRVSYRTAMMPQRLALLRSLLSHSDAHAVLC